MWRASISESRFVWDFLWLLLLLLLLCFWYNYISTRRQIFSVLLVLALRVNIWHQWRELCIYIHILCIVYVVVCSTSICYTWLDNRTIEFYSYGSNLYKRNTTTKKKHKLNLIFVFFLSNKVLNLFIAFLIHTMLYVHIYIC